MRVVALTIDYPDRRFIGSEVATHAMLTHLRSAGHEIAVFTTKGGNPWSIDGITVTPGIEAFRAASKHAELAITHIELGKKLKGLSVPLVGITHNARHEMLSRMTIAPWSLIVHNSQATADALEPARECPHIVVRPPVDWRDYHVDRTDADAITLINVTGEKGSDTFYEMARRMPNRRFIGVAGGWGDPDIRDVPNVEIVDHCADMRNVYAQTRILLMPSEHESWGRVAVEAMSSGIPVIASDLPGPAEAIGAGGKCVEPGWYDEYERLIVQLDDPTTYQQLSLAAATRAQELDPTADLDLFRQCMEALANRQRGPWNEAGLVTYRHLRTSRTRLVRAGSPQHVRLDRCPDVWTEYPTKGE